MEQELLARGVRQDNAAIAAELFETAEEAIPYVVSEAASSNGFRSAWKEYYSLRHRRFYYWSWDGELTSWETPPTIQFNQWCLDAHIFHVPVTVARRIFDLLHTACNQLWHLPDQLYGALTLLETLTRNVIQCRNSIEKYRRIRLDNAKIQPHMAAVPAAKELLLLAGFAEADGGVLEVPADANLSTIVLLHSRQAANFDTKMLHKVLLGGSTLHHCIVLLS